MIKRIIFEKLESIVGTENVKLNESLKKHTTFKVGGYAKLYVTPKDKITLVNTLEFCRENELRFFILGGGSDIVVPDKGLDCIVIKPENNNICIEGQSDFILTEKETIISRHEDAVGNIKNFISLEDLKYEEDESNKVKIKVGAGVSLPYLIQYTLQNELCGLQWFAYIPANIGGAIYNNIHGLHKFISDYTDNVLAYNKITGDTEQLSKYDMDFAYDQSIFQKGEYLVVEANLLLHKGDIAKARNTYSELLKRKINNQPKYPSAGSVFKNLNPDLAKSLNIPSISAGWLVDSVGLLGTQIGGAAIYENHGNFIINKGDATAKDIKKLVKLIQDKVYEKWGVVLEPEIKLF